MADEKDPKQEEAQDTEFSAARRRLLRTAIYVPPAVLGIVALTQGCAPGSCAPASCNPQVNCHPNQSCNPHP
jgi:hypothetical protein